MRLWARLRSQKRSDKEMDAGHVRDIASGVSWTPLKITRPPRSSKVRKATWETLQSGLEISAGLRDYQRAFAALTAQQSGLWPNGTVSPAVYLYITGLGPNVLNCRWAGACALVWRVRNLRRSGADVRIRYGP